MKCPDIFLKVFVTILVVPYYCVYIARAWVNSRYWRPVRLLDEEGNLIK